MKKAISMIVGWATLLGVLGVSCSQLGNTYDDTTWFGEYPVQTMNGTTGEMEDQTAVIGLHFEENGSTCAVTHGIVGLMGTNMIKYDVSWPAGNSFNLSKSAGEQTILYYSGTITGEEMELAALNCDGVAGAFKLKKTH